MAACTAERAAELAAAAKRAAGRAPPSPAPDGPAATRRCTSGGALSGVEERSGRPRGVAQGRR